MAAPVQSVNYYYGQKTRQESSQGNCKDLPLENGSNSRDGIPCDDVPVDKQNINSSGNAANASGMRDRSFQDGGVEQTTNVNSAHYPRNMDDNRVASDVNRYYPHSTESNMGPDEYGKMQERINPSQMSGYGNAMYNNRTNYMSNDQHGGPDPNPADVPPSSTQNHMFSNYNQSNMRPNFPPNSKSMGINCSRSSVSGQNTNVAPQNYVNNQRMMPSGHNISQQSGPTPTLNQLLQSPNPVNRYQNNYNEYSSSSNMKGNAEMNSGNQYAQQWNSPRPAASSAYPPQVGSSFRNQGSMNDPSATKGQQQPPPPPSNWGNHGNYPQQQMSPGAASGAAHYNSGNASYPRYPSPQPPQQSGPTPPPRSNSRGYPHQQPSYPNTRVSSPQRQQSPVPHANNQGSGQTPVPGSLSPIAASQGGGSNFISNEIQQEVPGPVDELSSGSDHQKQQQQLPAVASSPHSAPPSSSLSPGHLGSTAVTSPSSTPVPHQTAGSGGNNLNRPVPSPVSNTSRSMSPAVGNQNIPSSPRPSSVHSDTGSTGGCHPNPSPMPVSQQSGYHNPQPHVGVPNGPNSMGPPSYNGGNKMPPGMMAGNMPTGCMPSGSPGFPQGHYPNRGNAVSNVASGYGMSHPGNNYNANSSQYGAMPNYGPRMGNHVGQSGFQSGLGNQMSPGHYPAGYQGGAQSNAQGGAQAAAQAAVMAAANAATPSNTSRTPHYLKQHLQQKMSGSNAYQNQMQASGQAPYGCGPPQAASPVGAQTPNSVPPSTPLPPNNRMMTTSMPSSVHNTSSMVPSSGHNLLPNSVPSEGFHGGNKENSQNSVPNSSSTSLTQAVGTPITTTAMANSEMPSNMPPGGHDEASQHSIASTSSSQQEQDHTDGENSNPNRVKCYKEPISHPPTPVNTLPSPGAASMSSYHDEFENASSPSWPRTPASPVYNNQVYDNSHPPHHPPPPPHVQHPHPVPHHPKRPDGLMKLYELSDDPERRIFLDKLLRFNEERGSPMTNGPTLSKQPLDLFRLYVCVKERSGFQEVTKSRLWKEISIAMGTGSSASTAYALRKQYIKHLLPFECKFDRGGIDPLPLISQLESSSRKKKASAAQAQAQQNSQDGYHGMEGYPHRGAYPPGQYGPGGPMGGGQHMNSEYPGGNQNCPPGMMPNHMNSDSVSIQDPFSDDMQYQRNSFPPSQYGNNGPPPPPPPPPPPNRGAIGPQYHQGGYNSNNMPEQYNAGDPQQQYRRGSGGSLVQQDPNMNVGPQPRNIPPQQFSNFQGGQYENRERFEQPSNAMPPPPPSNQQYPQRFNSPSMPPSAGPPPESNFSSNSSAPRSPYPGSFNPPPPPPPPPPTSSTQMDNPPNSGNFQGPMPENYQNFPNQPPAAFNQNTSIANKTTPHNSGFQKREPFQSSPYPVSQGATTTTTPSKLLASITGNRNNSSNQYPPPYPPNQFRNDHQSSSGPNDSAPAGPGWRESNQFNQYGSPNQPNSREEWNSSRSGSNWSRFSNSSMPNGPVPAFSSNNSHQNHLQSNSSPVPNANSFMQHRFNQQKGPPFKPDSRFMAQQKVHHSSHPSSQFNNRREIIFPSDSIEALPPLMVRRKTLNMKDVGSVEAWRILMALKSGLLSESTWALDVLSVLLYDDSSVIYFSLRHLPGLLEILWEHFRRVLSKVFCISDDLESVLPGLSSSKKRKLTLSDEGRRENEDLDAEPNPSFDNEFDKCDFGIVQGINVNDKTKVLTTKDFTLKGRNGKPVHCVDAKDPFVSDSAADWDLFDNGFDLGYDHWTEGGGDTTFHIQTHFSLQESKNRFFCRLKDVKKEEDKCEILEECSAESSDSEDRTNKSCDENLKRPLEDCDDAKSPASKVPKTSSCEKESDEKSCDNSTEESSESAKDDDKQGYPKFRENFCSRVNLNEFEEEAYTRDEPSLIIVSDTQDDLARRCICLSNLLRNLSFIPGNDVEFAKHPGLLLLLGRLLLLHHKHLVRRPPQRNYDKDEDADFTDSCSSLHAEKEWWWDMLNIIRENTLVILSNISGHLDLSCYPEDISLPILDGLLHWSICPSAYAHDALPTMPPHSVLSPQRLSLETLCKICVLEANVDLLLVTPPFYRIKRLFGVLTKSLSKGEEPVVREFAVTLLSYFALSDSSICRMIALQGSCISLLIGFVEQAEHNALQVANTHGINMLRENPEMMGTSLDMMRRAASTLLCLSKVSENRSLFVQHQSRLLTLVMSQILDQHVAGIISEILFECSLVDDEPDLSLS